MAACAKQYKSDTQALEAHSLLCMYSGGYWILHWWYDFSIEYGIYILNHCFIDFILWPIYGYAQQVTKKWFV